MSDGGSNETQEVESGAPKVKSRRGTAWQNNNPVPFKDDGDDKEDDKEEEEDIEPIVIVQKKDKSREVKQDEGEGKHLGEHLQVEADPELPPGETLEVMLSKHEVGERPLKSALKKDTLPKTRSHLANLHGGLLHRQLSGADALQKLKDNAVQQAAKTRAPASITADDLDLEKGIGKEGVLMFNALLTAARKDVGAPRAWGYKAPLFKVIVKTKNLISSGRVLAEDLEDLHEPLNRLGNLFLQLLNAKKGLKGEQSMIKPTLLATLIQDVVTKAKALLAPHLEVGELEKAQPAFDYYSDANFVANFLNDPGYESEKRMMKQHARMMLKKLLKPQCAKPKCTTSRVRRQGAFPGSKLCARHHKDRVDSCYAPPGNFEHFLEGDVSDFKLTFHDFLDKQELKIGRLGPLFSVKKAGPVPKSEADQDQYNKPREEAPGEAEDEPRERESSIVKAESAKNPLECAVEHADARGAPQEEQPEERIKEASGEESVLQELASEVVVGAGAGVGAGAPSSPEPENAIGAGEEEAAAAAAAGAGAEAEAAVGGEVAAVAAAAAAADAGEEHTSDGKFTIPKAPVRPLPAPNSILIQFLLHVKTFREAATVKERKKFGPVIYERYLTYNAEREIEFLTRDPILMDPIHHSFEVGLAHIKPGLFHYTALYVEKLLRVQFGHFVHSPQYQEALAELSLPASVERHLDGETKEENEEDKLWESATKVTFSDDVQIVGFSDRND